MKKPGEVKVWLHGVDGSQYFPGHGVSFTRFTSCATGIGDTEAEAFDDALEMLSQSDEDWDIVEVERMCAEYLGPRALRHKTVEESIGESPGEESELHWWVSIDLKEEGKS